MTDIRSALEAARKALEPFAKAGELFGPRADGEYDLCVYKPAAGKEYEIVGDDLRRTGPALAQIDAALASLDAPQPDALREAGEALESGVSYMNALNRISVEFLTGKMSEHQYANACLGYSDGPERKKWAAKINAALARLKEVETAKPAIDTGALSPDPEAGARAALIDATSALAAATSAYERYCRKGVTGDALFSTRLKDFKAAVERARAALARLKEGDSGATDQPKGKR